MKGVETIYSEGSCAYIYTTVHFLLVQIIWRSFTSIIFNVCNYFSDFTDCCRTNRNSTAYPRSRLAKLSSTIKRDSSNSGQYSSFSGVSLLTHVCVRVCITDRMRDGFNEELGRWDPEWGAQRVELIGIRLSVGGWLRTYLSASCCDQSLSTIKIHEGRYDKKKA